jgi:Domain of unknown function (DUF4412)
MRKLFTLVAVFCFLLSTAQTSFEGLIELSTSTTQRPNLASTKMYFSALGGRVETEMKFSPNRKPFKTIRIHKYDTKDLYWVLNEAAETYSVTDLSNYKPDEREEKKVTVKVLGKELVMGLNCVHILISTSSGETEMWTTKELMDYTAYKKLNESDSKSRISSFANALIEAKAEGFPVKTLKKDGKGGNITIEIVKIERKTIDKSLFEVPSNYTKTETPTSGIEGVLQEMKQINSDPEKN